MRIIVATLIAFGISTSAGAQDKDLVAALQKLDVRVFKPDSAEAKLRQDTLKQLRDDVNRRDVEVWRKIETKADWEKFRDERIAKLKESLGRFPETPKEVKVVTTKKLQGDGFTVECILYESRPNFFVSANLYVPADTSKPMPGFIVIHSHHNPKTQGELQDMGMTWARQGCMVLIPDMIGHGERRQHPFADAKSYAGEFKVGRQDYYFRYNTALQLHLVGESLMGWMVWDLMRGLDVLYQRPNLDKSKVMAFGSVAAGGDACAVFAALDQRVTAAAPFNFGGPQPETPKLGEDAEFAFNYMGGGSWESTRNLRLSARDGFLPWLIVGSIAPRGLIYGHEFAWDEKRDPVWTRLQKIWGFYGATDKLAWTKGRGSVKGTPPESTHCNNIGPEHRKGMYPTLNKWFGLPAPEKEYQTRFESSALQCWTEEAKKALKPKLVHEILGEKFVGAVPRDRFDAVAWNTLLGIPDTNRPAKMDVRPRSELLAGYRVAELVTTPSQGTEPPLVSLVIVPPMAEKAPVVICLAQEGRAGFVKYRAETISILLKNGIAVCIPDLDRPGGGRGRQSGATSVSATELMHGRTVPGVQLRQLTNLVQVLRAKQAVIALWGDSFAKVNDANGNLAVPLDAAKLPHQSEPMGGLLALLYAAGNHDDVKAVYVRGGLVSFRSMLDSRFCYFPHDAVIPGVLLHDDLSGLALANRAHGLRLEALVDGLNRRVDQKTLTKVYQNVAAGRQGDNPLVLREEASSPNEVAAWLAAQLGK